MSRPIAPATGIALAFPDVCLTPVGPSMVPIPYPNIAQLASAQNTATDVLIGPSSLPALLLDSEVPTSSGDEAGTGGGVASGGPPMGSCRVAMASTSVVYGSSQKGLARFGDMTEQNRSPGGTPNATGQILSAFPTVLVGD